MAADGIWSLGFLKLPGLRELEMDGIIHRVGLILWLDDPKSFGRVFCVESHATAGTVNRRHRLGSLPSSPPCHLFSKAGFSPWLASRFPSYVYLLGRRRDTVGGLRRNFRIRSCPSLR